MIPCARCGGEFPPEEMTYCADPFAAEMWDDDTEAWYCQDCLEDSRMSI